MPDIINFELIKHPINWVIVILMVLIAAMAVHFVLKWESLPG